MYTLILSYGSTGHRLGVYNSITLFYDRRFDVGHLVNLYICEFIKYRQTDVTGSVFNKQYATIQFWGHYTRDPPTPPPAGLIDNNERGGRAYTAYNNTHVYMYINIHIRVYVYNIIC